MAAGRINKLNYSLCERISKDLTCLHFRNRESDLQKLNEDRSCCICLEPYVDEQGNPIIPEPPEPPRDHDHIPYDIIHHEGIPHEDIPNDVMYHEDIPHEVVPHDIIHPEDIPHEVIPHDMIHPEDIPHDMIHHEDIPHEVPHDIIPNEDIPHDIIEDIRHNVIHHDDVTPNNFQILQDLNRKIFQHQENEETCNQSRQNCNVDENGGLVLGALKCGHAFHFECIWRWMQSRTKCPVCRSYTEIDLKDIQAVSLFVVFPGLDPQNRRNDSGNENPTTDDKNSVVEDTNNTDNSAVLQASAS